MTALVFKQAWHLLAPGGVVLLLAVGFLRPHGLPAWVQEPVSALPVIVLGFGIVFGWYLSSSRLILSLFVLVCLDRGIILSASAGLGSDPGTAGLPMFALATFLAPVNLLALSLVREGGVTNWRGIAGPLLVLSQPLLVLWLCLPEQADLVAPFRLPLLSLPTSAWTPLQQPALLAFGGALSLLTVKFLLFHDPLDGGAAWTTLTTFLALHGLQYGWNATNFLAAAGLTLFLSLVQASYQQAYRDDLTGALGRLAFDEKGARLGGRFVVAIAGVDQLKQYRQLYGKTVTDQVLRLVAPKIIAAAETGRVYRLAGDEFTLLFETRTVTDTLATLEQIRKSVEQTGLRLHSRTRVREGGRPTGARAKAVALPVSLSLGVAETSALNPSLTAVTKAAYRALYEAKGEGGNLVKRGSAPPAPAKAATGRAGRIVTYSEFEH